jgi:urocanate hydratase
MYVNTEFGTKFGHRHFAMDSWHRNDNNSSVPDMAVQNCIGDSFRGATWVALHNGGGVGW